MGPLSFDFITTFILVEIMCKCIKSSCNLILELHRTSWPRGGMVTQRIANPSIPVRFWAWPPKFFVVLILKKSILISFLGSSVGRAVDC